MMYPDWPRSAADLVPLPPVEGPKLEAFDFEGPQEMEFLEFLGEGLHAFVFKVKIKGRDYALKLFRFPYQEDWKGPELETYDPVSVAPFYNHAEPFSCECRAFGRLQETGHEYLAIKCFGYLLLSEENESAMRAKFSDLPLDFNGNIDNPGVENERERYLTRQHKRDGKKPPPIRGILKEIGQEMDLQAAMLRKLLRYVIKFHQLGIFHLDIAHRQILDGKLSDFSCAITTPHFTTNPELNPRIDAEWRAEMECETFYAVLDDYLMIDAMVDEWNWDVSGKRRNSKYVSFRVYPGWIDHRLSWQQRYPLRHRKFTGPVYAFVDPRLYDWRSSAPTEQRNEQSKAVDEPKETSGEKVDGRTAARRPRSRPRKRLAAKPQKWCCERVCRDLLSTGHRPTVRWTSDLGWEFRDGFIWPRRRAWYDRTVPGSPLR